MTFNMGKREEEKKENSQLKAENPRIAGKGGSIIVYHEGGSSDVISFSDLTSDLELVERVAGVLESNKKEEERSKKE